MTMTMTLKAQREARIAAKAAEKAAKAAAELARIHANPIYAAIAPQKAETVARAQAYTREQLVAFAAKFPAGADFKALAPRPDSFRTGREQYNRMMAYRSLAQRVVEVKHGGWPGYAETVIGVDAEGIDKLVEEAGEEAAASFDAYVAKLTAKVGECDEAAVCGDLWHFSTLTVRKGDATESWHTQQILNFSVYGKAFNQWPTRKMQGGAK
jgi:hypothetical protein